MLSIFAGQIIEWIKQQSDTIDLTGIIIETWQVLIIIIIECMLGQGNLQEEILKTYVQKVFQKYDTDKSGTLDQSEMTVFFNQLFKSLGIGRSVTPQESLEAIKTIDKNFDGSVNKQQLFIAFKAMLNKSQQQQMQQVQPPPPYYGQPGYPQYGQYGYGGYYPPPQNNPYNPYPNYNYPPPQQQYGYYPQSPYNQNSQPPMMNNQNPTYGSNQQMYHTNPQNQNMMYSQTQQNPYNQNPYANTATNPYKK